MGYKIRKFMASLLVFLMIFTMIPPINASAAIDMDQILKLGEAMGALSKGAELTNTQFKTMIDVAGKMIEADVIDYSVLLDKGIEKTEIVGVYNVVENKLFPGDSTTVANEFREALSQPIDYMYLLTFADEVKDEVPIEIKDALKNRGIDEDQLLLDTLETLGNIVDKITLATIKGIMPDFLDGQSITTEDKEWLKSAGINYDNLQTFYNGDDLTDTDREVLREIIDFFADKYNLTVSNPAQGATQLTLPEIEGYVVKIISSSNLNVIALDGKIIPPSVATEVTFELTLEDATGEIVHTQTVTVTVPAKSTGSVTNPALELAQQKVSEAESAATDLSTLAKINAAETALETAKSQVNALADTVSEKAGLLGRLTTVENMINEEVTARATALAEAQEKVAAAEGLKDDLTTQAKIDAAKAALSDAQAKVDALAVDVTEKAGLQEKLNVVDTAIKAAEEAMLGTLELAQQRVAEAEAKATDLTTQVKIDAAKAALTEAQAKVNALADTVSEKAGLLSRLTVVDNAIKAAEEALGEPAEITINGPAIVKQGETITLQGVVKNKSGNSMGVTPDQITWSSDKENVATVNQGVVTGVGAGFVTITATYEGFTATKNIEVFKIPDLFVSGISDGAIVNTAVAIIGYCQGKNVTISASNGQTVTHITKAQLIITDEGKYTVTVSAEGVGQTQTLSFEIDKTAPTVTITNANSVTNNHDGVTPIIDFSGDYVLNTKMVTLNGKAYDGSTITREGHYVLIASAKDVAGNVGKASAEFDITWDNSVPQISFLNIIDGKTYESVTPSIGLSTGSNSANYNYTVNITKPNGTVVKYQKGETAPTLTDEGKYRMVVEAKNPSYIDLLSTASIGFIIDNQAPTVTISGVEANGVYNNPVTPLVTLNDTVATQQILKKNALVTLSKDGKTVNKYAIGDTVSKDGNYILTAETKDALDHKSNVASVSFKVDTSKPSITITGAVNGTTYYKDVTMTVTVDEEATLNVTGNGETINLVNNQATFSAADGEYEHYSVVITATDNAGNVATEEIFFTVDKLPVDIKITGVQEGDVFNEAPYITFVTYDKDGNELGNTTATLDGNTFTQGGKVAEGNHTLIVTYNNGTNSYSKTINFTVDNTAPIVNIDSVAKNGETVNEDINVKAGDVITVKATVANEENIDDIYFTVGTSIVGMKLQGDSYVGSWTVEGSTLTGVNLSVFVLDAAGNNGDTTYAYEINIDNTKPTVSRIVTPAKADGEHGTYKAADMSIVLEANTGDTIHYTLNDASEQTADTTVTITPEQGTNKLKYYAQDKAGNTSEKKVFNFEYDSLAPGNVTLTSDATGLTNKAVIKIDGTVAGEGQDNGSQVILKKDGEIVAKANIKNNDTFTLSGVKLSEGENNFILVARDKAGNESTNAVTLSRTLDTTVPILTVNSIDDTHYKVSINEEVSDVTATFNGVTVANISQITSGEYTIETSEPNDGVNKLMVSAIDEAGNTGKGSFTNTYLPPGTAQENIEVADGTTMDIPADAFPGDTPIRMTVNTGDAKATANSKLKAATPPIEFSFSPKPVKPVVIKFFAGLGRTDLTLIHIKDDGTKEEVTIVNSTSSKFNKNNLIEDVAVYLADTGDVYLKTKSFSAYQALVDEEDPVINITTTDLDINGNDTAVIAGTIDDADANVAITQVLIDGEAMDLSGKDTDKTFNISLNLADGTHEVQITATDAAGNSATLTRSYVVDKGAPTLTVSASKNITKSDSINITIEVDESVEILINGASQGNYEGMDELTVPLTEGVNTFEIVAQDALGNEDVETISITRDSILPTITIAGVSDGDICGSGCTITVSANEGLTPTVTIDGIPFTSGDTYDAEGSHTLVATATDLAGNTITKTIKFTIDTSLSVINITGVDNGGIYTINKVVEITATNATSLQVTQKVDGGAEVVVPVEGMSKSLAIDVANNEQHTYIIKVVAQKVDEDQTRTAISNVSFTIDKKDPVVTITPVSATTASTVTITGTIDETADIYLNGSLKITGQEAGTFSISGVSLIIGANTFAVKAVDLAGREKVATITITRSEASSGGGGGGGGSSADTSKTISPDKDINFTSDDDILNVTVPVGAVDENGSLTVEKVRSRDQIGATKGLIKVGSLQYEITVKSDSGKNVTKFNKDLILEFSYKDSDLTNDIAEKDLKVCYWDEDMKSWIVVPSTVDAKNNVITARTNHLTVYGLMAVSDFPALNDVSKHWAEFDIMKLVSLNVASGDPSGDFRPNANISRQEFAKIVVLAAGLTPETNPELNFTDANKIAPWAKGYVAAAVKAGIINGYQDNTFRAQNDISRAELATMIIRALDEKVSSQPALSFTDAENIPTWAKGYVAKAVNLEIINGYSDGTFKANNQATRAESAKMISKMLEAKF